jgi:hypothetical protein
MPRDTELDRLKAAQDLAFQRKQDAYEAQQVAWERRSAARDAMNRAYDAKQSAYAVQDASWQELQRVRGRNGPQIDALNAQQERAFEAMKSAFADASAAHDRRDGAAARMYADQGHAHKAESQRCVAERRALVAEIRSAKDAHEATRPAFQEAKRVYDTWKQAFDRAKADHERLQAEFRRAKAEFDAAAAAFKARLDKVKAENAKRNTDRRELARKAGVPVQYLDQVWVSRKSDGTTNIYFGGVGKPDGPGHGHYVLDRNDNVTYKRDPFDPHGAQNFQEADAALPHIRSARSQHEPRGTNEHGGVFYRRSDGVNSVLHVTQYFDDGYRVSWDATPLGTRNVHWTNQRVASGHPARHIPPPDAIL